MAVEPEEPIEEAEDAVNEFSDLAGSAMQAVKDKMAGALHTGVQKVAEAWEGGGKQQQEPASAEVAVQGNGGGEAEVGRALA